MANSYLTRSISSTGTNTKGTFSGWIKRGNIASDYPRFFAINTDANRYLRLFFHNDQKLHLYIDNGSGIGQRKTTRVFRDTSAWYHIVVAIDSLQGTASDRIKVWVNGVQETVFDSTINPAQGANMMINNSGSTFVIGRHESASTDYFNGYMSHVSWVDGTALTPTSFGETDSTSGIWKFKSPSGITWGTNGVHLKFENSGNLGLDSSGQGNNFTVNGNLKQALDTPSNVHATLNPLVPSTNATFSNGSNTITGSQADNYSQSTISTLGVSAGKWYCEAKYTTANSNVNPNVGIATLENFRYDVNNTGASGFANVRFDGQVYVDGSSGSSSYWGSNPVAGDIIMFALDMDNGKFYLGKNGSWENSGVPTSGSTGTGSITSSRSGTQAINVRYLASVFDFNFGNGFFGTTAISSAGSNGNGSLFEYDVPNGYYALNTKNINTYG